MHNLERPDRYCWSKIRHETRRGAQVERAATGIGRQLGIYKCPACGGWHVGHKGREYRPRRRRWHRERRLQQREREFRYGQASGEIYG